MQKSDLIKRVTEILWDNGVRKPITIPKQTLHISDNEGHQKDFVVKKTDKSVSYNETDVAAILNTCIKVVEDAVKKGESVSIQGFGSLEVNERAARRVKHPTKGEIVEIKAHYIPKFTFGRRLRIAAKLYELSLNEGNGFIEPLIKEDDIDNGD